MAHPPKRSKHAVAVAPCAMPADVTVVTAYYSIPSKSSQETYLQWIRGFWPSMSCALVVFTEPDTLGIVREAFRGCKEDRTLFIGLPRCQWRARTRWGSAFAAACEKDPEKGVGEGSHSRELYEIWYEKKEFVDRVIALNPFGSNRFVWADAGICRYESWPQKIQAFPVQDRIPSDRMLVLQINKFQEGETAETDFSKVDRIGGGVLAAGVTGWSRWSAAYEATLQKFLDSDRFIGKDQNIMASMILEDPSLVEICPAAKEGLGPIGCWFTLLFYLAGWRVS